MVVVRTIREPGAAGFCDELMVHELIPTLPTGTEITAGVTIAEVVVELDDVVGDARVVVDASPEPTIKLKRGLTAKLYESPVHVFPKGLSRPYAYIWYVPTADGAVTVTVNVAVRRSAERVGRPYTPLIHGVLRTM